MVCEFVMFIDSVKSMSCTLKHKQYYLLSVIRLTDVHIVTVFMKVTMYIYCFCGHEISLLNGWNWTFPRKKNIIYVNFLSFYYCKSYTHYAWMLILSSFIAVYLIPTMPEFPCCPPRRRSWPDTGTDRCLSSASRSHSTDWWPPLPSGGSGWRTSGHSSMFSFQYLCERSTVQTGPEYLW